MGGWVHDTCSSYVLDFVVLIFYGCENVARDAKAVYQGNTRKGCVSERERRVGEKKAAEQRALG